MLKLSALFIFQIIVFTNISQAQVWKWANSLGSANTSTTVKTIKPYTNSTILLCGSFAAPSLDFGSQSVGNNGQDDAYLAIADAEGEYTWATSFGGANNESITDLASHSNGEFVAIGNFSSIFLAIGDTTLSNSGESDGFIVKFNADKSIAWTKKIGSTEIEEMKSVRIDESGNVYVSGQVINKFTLTTIHVFVRKYSANGSLLWEQIGPSEGSYPQISGLALDANSNVYLCGGIMGTITFENTVLTSSWPSAGFIVKFSSTGALIDTTMNFNYDKYNGIEIHQNAIYTCAERINWGMGWGWPLSDAKILTQKLDTELNSIWNREAGGLEPIQSLDIARSISVDNEGNAYLTGSYFSDTLEFAGQTMLNPFNINYYYPQIFVLKYSASGEEIWGKSIGGIHSDEAAAIYAFGNDQFYIAGNFESNPTTIGTFNLNNTSTLDSIYVHLQPARFGRKPMAFLALFDIETSVQNSNNNSRKFNLWPNPTNDLLWINCSSAPSNTSIQITSSDGRLVQQSNFTHASKKMLLDVSEISSGIYFITVTNETGSSTEKFVKH
jgi:hypothetical protein